MEKCLVFTHPPAPSLKKEGEKVKGIPIPRPLPSRGERKQKVYPSPDPFPQEGRGES